MSRFCLPQKLVMASLATGFTLLTSVAFAQDGTFKDVPNDHWAYSAIERLVKLNPPVFKGDPAGALIGKRNLTRNEMALVLARLLENTDANYAKKSDLANVPFGVLDTVKRSELDALVKKSDLEGFATRADVDALRRSVGESQSELATLSVSLDAIKKSLAGLEGRLGKSEKTPSQPPKGTKALPARPEQRGKQLPGRS